MYTEIKLNNYSYYNNHMNIVVPMAGRGSRFQESFPGIPKPLVTINDLNINKTLVELAIESSNVFGKFHFIVLKEHEEQFQISKIIQQFLPSNQLNFIYLDDITEGAACTCLKAKEFIDNSEPLFIYNCDQVISWDPRMSLDYFLNYTDYDGVIVYFDLNELSNKYSFLEMDSNHRVRKVVEKKQISNHATTGHYIWKHGFDFVRSVELMIKENERTNGEFYLAPSFNFLCTTQDIRGLKIEEMYCLGTPEEMDISIKRLKNKIMEYENFKYLYDIIKK